MQRSPPENQKPKRPEGSKINELKRKIEFMQRSCKTTEKQSVLEMPVQRKISQERATQTAEQDGQGNQFKRRAEIRKN